MMNNVFMNIPCASVCMNICSVSLGKSLEVGWISYVRSCFPKWLSYFIYSQNYVNILVYPQFGQRSIVCSFDYSHICWWWWHVVHLICISLRNSDTELHGLCLRLHQFVWNILSHLKEVSYFKKCYRKMIMLITYWHENVRLYGCDWGTLSG